MKKFSKIVGLIFIGLLAIVILLMVVGKLEEKRIADIALLKISKSINAPLRIKGISLNLIRKFPFATIELENVNLGSLNTLNLSDSSIKDLNSLARIDKIYVSARPVPLFNGILDIVKVEIRGAQCNYIIDKKGVSNFDFLMDTTASDTSASIMNIVLNELTLRDINCSYYDSLNNSGAHIVIPKAKIKGAIQKEQINGDIKGSLQLTNCFYKTTPLHLMKKATIDYDVSYADNLVSLKDILVSVDEAEVNIEGSLSLEDKMDANLKIIGKEINLSKFLKYIPKQTFNQTGVKKLTGIFNFNGSIKGFLIDSIMPEIEVKFEVKKGFVQPIYYPIINNISVNGDYTNGKNRNNYSTRILINNFHAETVNSKIDLSANFNNLDNLHYNLQTAFAINLSDFNSLIPDSLISDIQGKLQGKFSSKGMIPDTINVKFVDYLMEHSRLELNLNNLKLSQNASITMDSLSGNLIFDRNHLSTSGITAWFPLFKAKLKDLSINALFTGKASDPETFVVDLNSFIIKTNKCSSEGNFRLKNMKVPEYNLMANVKLDLAEIKAFLPDTLLKDLSGKLIAQVSSSGVIKYDSLSNQLMDLLLNKSSFYLNMNKITCELPDTSLSIRDVSGIVDLKSDTIKINNLSGIFTDIDFKIDSTKILNIYKSVIKSEPSQLFVEGRFYLGDLNYTVFAPFIDSDKDKSVPDVQVADNNPKSKLKFQFKGKLGIRSFTYKKAKVDQISALFNLTDSLYIIDQFKFNGFKGKHITSVRYAIREKEQTLWIKNRVENLDVNQLLIDFDNFKEFYEPSITSSNISGFFSARVNAQLLFRNDSLIRSKMYVKGDSLKLEKGIITRYEPLKLIEPYLTGIDNLDELDFKTIISNVFVFQDTVYVPTTLIVSNKLDANAFGKKSFGTDYEYHFTIFMSDLFLGKSERIKKKQDKTGEIATDSRNRGIPLRYGSRGVDYDLEKDRNEMERSIKTSERLLKLRFNPYIVSYETGIK